MSNWDGVDTQIGKFISRSVFNRRLEYFRLTKDSMGSDNIGIAKLSSINVPKSGRDT